MHGLWFLSATLPGCTEGPIRGKLWVCCLWNSKAVLGMRRSSEPASCLGIIMPQEQSHENLQCTNKTSMPKRREQNSLMFWTQLCLRLLGVKSSFYPQPTASIRNLRLKGTFITLLNNDTPMSREASPPNWRMISYCAASDESSHSIKPIPLLSRLSL